MAEAVENAEVVCCFMTPDYQKSYNCQRELEYANELAKKNELWIIPCMIGDRNDRKWKPSSWLGFITSGANYINFRDDSDSQVQLQATELIKRIQNQSSSSTAESTALPVKVFETIRQKYLRDSTIKRLMNEESLSIEQSYINLAIVESKEQQDKEKKLKQHGRAMMPEQADKQGRSVQSYNDKILNTFEEIYGIKTSIDVKDIFRRDQTRKILILGRAGIGKSTFCQFVTYQWAKGRIWSEYELVVLIRLRKLTNNRYLPGGKYTLVDLLEKEFFPCDDLSKEQTQAFKELCRKGQVLWILDGYDEFAQNTPEQWKDVFDHVCETQHHILTSRPYAINLPYAVKMEITGFTDDNIVKYVQQFFNQFEDTSVHGQKLLNFLKSNPGIWGVAHVPVNLELICSLWANNDWSETKVLTMTTLYDNIIEWLCRRHLRRQNIDDQEMTKQTVYKKCERELQFLEHLAFKAMEQNKIILPPALLEEIEDESECCLVDHPQLLNMGILKSFDDKPVGNRNQTKKEHYFVHLSFQEHFAARHLLRKLKNSICEDASHLINDNKYKPHFQLVFIFASGLLAQSYYKSCLEKFWATIQGEPLDLVGLKHTQFIIQCLDELGDQTVFPARANYIKSICELLGIGVSAQSSVIAENISTSLRRTNSLLNKPLIQNKLIELMQIPDAKSKHMICYIMSRLPISEPVPKLLSAILVALSDKDSYIRSDACRALGKIGEKAATNEVIAGLLNTLVDQYLYVRRHSCEALGKICVKTATNDVITRLIDTFRDSNSGVREKACDAISKIGANVATNDVIAGLINALGNEHSEMRRNACRALGNLGEKAATNEVIARLSNTLQDKDLYARVKACEALGKMGAKAATNDVIVRLSDACRNDDPLFRVKACEALGEIGGKAPTNDVVTSLIDALCSEHDDVSAYAREAIRKILENAATNSVISPLSDKLRDGDWHARAKACEAFGNLDEIVATNEVIALLSNALRDEYSDVRRYACEAFGKITAKAATNDAIVRLVDTLRDVDAGVRTKACEALAKIGKKAATMDMIARLNDALLDEDLNVRAAACEALGNIGETAATNDVIARLIDLLRDGSSDIRGKACNALGKIGEKAASGNIIVALSHALRDEDLNVKAYACNALVSVGGKTATTSVITCLSDALRDEQSYIRWCACIALHRISEKVAMDEVIACITDALGNEYADVREHACELIGKKREKAATNDVIVRLTDLLRDEDENVRAKACEALGNMGEKAATFDVIVRLTNALRDTDWNVQNSACKALGMMGEKAAINDVFASLIKTFQDENWDVRRHACAAFGKIGGKVATKEMITRLLDTLHGDYCYGTSEACEALGMIGERAPTKEVIVALISVVREQMFGQYYQQIPSQALERAICSYDAIKELDSNMISKLYLCVRQFENTKLAAVPRDQLLKVFLETENDAWLPLVKYVALLQGVAITAVENTIILYDSEQILEFVVEPELMGTFRNVFRKQFAELERDYIVVSEIDV